MARGCFSVCMLMHADADASGFEMKLRSFFQLITLSSLFIFYSMGGWLGGRGWWPQRPLRSRWAEAPPKGGTRPQKKTAMKNESGEARIAQ